MQMSEFFKKNEIMIVFYTLHFTSVQIFRGDRPSSLGGGGMMPPPPGRTKTSNSPAFLGLINNA